jgi:ABC-2 type transport system permease protein
MNIFFLEFKQNLRSFIFWMIGMGFLMYAGIAKATALSSQPDAINAMFVSWPKVVLATFGFAGLDITTLGGYFGCMWFYAALCAALYGIGLGVKLTTLEINDKNADFVFSKPVERSRVMTSKTLAHLVYIILFALLTYLFSLAGVVSLGIENDINSEMILLCGALVFIGLIYYGIGAIAGALSAKKGGLVAYLVFLCTYVLGILYDIAEKGTDLIRVLAPMKYFDPVKVLKSVSLPTPFVILSALLCAVMIASAYSVMSRKDL